jgi:spore germination protein GerM
MYFWKGFEKQGTQNVNFKKHVIVLCWDESNKDVKVLVNKVRMRHPTVKFKAIEASKNPSKVSAHKISDFPTVLLLRNGREVSRLGGKEARSTTLLEEIFRKATT